MNQNNKNDILAYVYQHIPIAKLKYKPLNTPDTLLYLQQNKDYYVVPNYKGTICYIVFYKNKDKCQAWIVNRFQLKPDITDVNLDKLIVEPIYVNATNTVYNGTILEGTLINTKGEYVFMITDSFYLGNENVIKLEMKQKLEKVQTFINEEFNFDDSEITFKVEQLKTYLQLGELVYSDIPKLPYKTQGLIFLPKLSKLRIIYNTQIRIDTGTNKKTAVNEGEHDDYKAMEATFLIKKTKIIDVYPLYLRSNGELQKYGTAYIPSIDCSKFCSKLFKQGLNEMLVTCYYKNGKWVPNKISNKEKPDKYSQVIKLINENKV